MNTDLSAFVILTAADIFGVTQEAMRTPVNKTRRVCVARSAAALILREHGGLSLAAIAETLGLRSSASALNAIRRTRQIERELPCCAAAMRRLASLTLCKFRSGYRPDGNPATEWPRGRSVSSRPGQPSFPPPP